MSNRSPAGGSNRNRNPNQISAGDSKRNRNPNQIPAGDSNRNPNQIPAGDSNRNRNHLYSDELLARGGPYPLYREMADKVNAVLEKQGKKFMDSGNDVQTIVQALLANDLDPDKTYTFLEGFKEPKHRNRKPVGGGRGKGRHGLGNASKAGVPTGIPSGSVPAPGPPSVGQLSEGSPGQTVASPYTLSDLDFPSLSAALPPKSAHQPSKKKRGSKS